MLAAALFLGILPTPAAYAAGTTVQVSLPSHAVTLNGQTVSSDYSRYPLIVYKDITYFPMTYYDCRLLGVSTAWSKEDGLSIEKNNASLSQYIREVQSTQNAKTQQAKIADGPLTVNGKVINNSSEPYPILSFRDVAYFPLTWRFAVDEFGWDYEFDGNAGLTISNLNAALTFEGGLDVLVSDYGGLMGTGNMKLPCMFGVFKSEEQTYISIDLYNTIGEDIRILKDDFQWEYRIYRMIGEKEELVCRKAIPFFSGELPASSFAHMSIPDNYWNETTPNGEYQCVLVHPEKYRYQILGEEQIRTEPTEGDGYRVTFSDTITHP